MEKSKDHDRVKYLLKIINGRNMAKSFRKLQEFSQKGGPDQGPPMILAPDNSQDVADTRSYSFQFLHSKIKNQKII